MGNGSVLSTGSNYCVGAAVLHGQIDRIQQLAALDSNLSFDNVLQHLTIKRQISDDPLQPVILFFQVAQSLHL